MTQWETGVHLGPYQLLAHIGAGGMGEVWKARDTRLDRIVAIKRLKAEHTERFKREARAIAALNHPHICQIYDVGSDYLVMEYVEGEPLKSPLPPDQAVRLAIQIAEALEAAHHKGIVHRDLKPTNILVTGGGVKLLDFGLAKMEDPVPSGDTFSTLSVALTQAGAVVGTVAYMSPEQAQGQAVDSRSDIFSFGLVLYEVLSGKRAFTGGTPFATMSAIVRDEPSPLQAPAALEQILRRCLAKQPSARYQTITEVKTALEKVGVKTAEQQPSIAALPFANSIAVLPFANASREPDAEYLSDGITESILNSLSQIAQLRVTPRSTVFRYKGQNVDPQALGRELNVRVVLTGRVMQRGETLVVGAELMDVVEGTQLWGERYNRKLADIFAVEEEIAKKISESLRMRLSGEEKQRLAKRFTENSEAYQLYLKGRHYWTKRTPQAIGKGIEFFQQAIEKDPAYALAYTGLADCYSILSVYSSIPPKEGLAKAKAAAAAAVAFDDQLAEGHTSLAFIRAIGDCEWSAADKGFQRACEINPSYWVTPYWFSLILAARSRFGDAERQLRRAQELEPLSSVVAHAAAWMLIATRRYEEAIDLCLKTLDADTSHPIVKPWLGLAYLQSQRYEDAIQVIQELVHLFGEQFAMGWLGHAHAMAGNQPEAHKLLREMLEMSERRHIDPYSVALVYCGLGDHDRAFEWLDKGCGGHSCWQPIFVKGDPRWDPLRPDTRFTKLLERLRLEP